ncbi:MAG: hypothetical protein COB16_04200 [Rhodobacteraceae bacterium]|nr:MAG: hypothetical protein COB16_04200 [Paracoccaceae bacterium]
MKTQSNWPARSLSPRVRQSKLRPTSTPTAGLVRDTVVLTRNGEVAVQDIRPGEHVITRGAGLVQVLAIGQHRVLSRAISIAAGSLGDTRPDSDMVVPADQQILIRDWRAQALFGCDQTLAPASALVDGEFIRDLGLQVLELYSLQLDDDHVIYAGGLEVVGGARPELDLRPAA